MVARLRAIAPLALVIGVLGFLWTEFALNFQFHWVTTDTIPGSGLSVPARFQLIVWLAFLGWGLFFAAGGDSAAFGKVVIASIFGSLGFLTTVAIAPQIADIPDFWSISLIIPHLVLGDWYYVSGTFVVFGGLFGLWVATGIDNWQPNGGGIGSGIARLADPATAGTGAFGGVLSTPFYWVWFSGLVSAICGVILGFISAKVAAALHAHAAGSDGRRIPLGPRTSYAGSLFSPRTATRLPRVCPRFG